MTRPRVPLRELVENPDLAALARSPSVELLAGELAHQPLPSTGVVAAVVELAAAMDQQAVGLRVGVRDAFAFEPSDLLRPEISVARPPLVPILRLAPAAACLVLAVLVADRMELAQQRLRRCAAAGVVEVWVVAVEERSGAAFTDPREGRYRRRELLLPGEAFAPGDAPWLRVVPVAAPRDAPKPVPVFA